MEETAIVKQEAPVTYFAATNGEEMARAQGGLQVWADARIAQATMDVLELDRAVENARKNKWAVSALQRALGKAEKLKKYYVKVGAALSAGYVLVPAFPVNVFAIRTTKRVPPLNVNTTKEEWGTREQTVHSEMPAIGEGEYKSNLADRTEQYHSRAKDAQGKETSEIIHLYQNEEFQDVTFPMVACRPEVMNATARAMALKIFDEIGIVTEAPRRSYAPVRRGDPLIIGSICQAKVGYTQKRCHFLITWHVNVADI